MRLRIVVRGAVRAQRIPSLLSAMHPGVIQRFVSRSRNGLRGTIGNLLEADFWTTSSESA